MQRLLNKVSSFVLAMALCLGITATVGTISSKSIVADAATGSYYSSITATSGTALLGQLHDLITTTHTKYTSYSDCKAVNYSHTDPGSSSAYLMEFYTQEDISVSSFDVSGGWNREHVWAQSLSNDLWGTSGGGSDLHHIRPAEKDLNAKRGNLKYGEVSGGTEYKASGTNVTGGYANSNTFEPLDKVKGDVARIVLYVYTHYNTYAKVNGTTNGSGSAKFGTLPITNIISASNENAAFDLLVKWNKNDPVDDIERTRNEEVYKVQGNRNPFIDNETYADAIWGSGSVTPNPGGDTTPELTGLTLSSTSFSLSVGSSKSLTVTATPANASNTVTWSTSDSNIATVSNGVVTAKAAGTATITATSTVKTNIKATATVTVTNASTPAPTDGSFTINFSSFGSAGSYNFYDWSSGGVSGIAYIYGSGSKMQFNSSKTSKYLASTTATSAPIKSVTLKLDGDSNGWDWQLLTSSSAYGKTSSGNPSNGTDYGTKKASTSGVTWTVSGNDTYFALVYTGTGMSIIDSIVVTYGNSGDVGGGDKEDDNPGGNTPGGEDNPGGDVGGNTDSSKLAQFHTAVTNIVSSGSLKVRLASINNAIAAYKALSRDEKASATADLNKLNAAIDAYNQTVRAYNDESKAANDAINGGQRDE